ncbi:hypothetical protein [Weissella fangxianensis]|uniref:hypothetical protein n=1 Tax=Weissella fangxianensis TaxID=2953879 RepID=UPI0021571D0C|nr:hypothetical protein [Weissella fangxianensis]
MANDPITSDTHQQLMADFSVGGPQVGEKNITLKEGFDVRDASGGEQNYTQWDVIHRADETYWSPLNGDRKTLYDITDYAIKSKKSDQWISIAEWFNSEEL